jgi:hypothetical protein
MPHSSGRCRKSTCPQQYPLNFRPKIQNQKIRNPTRERPPFSSATDSPTPPPSVLIVCGGLHCLNYCGRHPLWRRYGGQSLLIMQSYPPAFLHPPPLPHPTTTPPGTHTNVHSIQLIISILTYTLTNYSWVLDTLLPCVPGCGCMIEVEQVCYYSALNSNSRE